MRGPLTTTTGYRSPSPSRSATPVTQRSPLGETERGPGQGITATIAPVTTAVLTAAPPTPFAPPAPRGGAHGLSHMGLREGPGRFFFDGEPRLGFRIAAGAAVALGPPTGPPDTAPSVLGGFRDWCRRRGLRAVVCGLPAELADAARDAGFGLTPAGGEAIIDPRRVEPRGRQWREVRAALNRARARGLRFRWMTPEERAIRRHETGAVSEAWLRGKRPPELRFAFGGAGALLDPDARAAAAEDAEGRMAGFITWVPAGDGWMLELLRYRPGVMAGLADYLTASSLLAFRDEDCPYASLSGAPLTNLTACAPWTNAALAALRHAARPLYNADGLRRFKQKFNPAWTPLYLAHTGRFGLPRAALAILRASLT